MKLNFTRACRNKFIAERGAIRWAGNGVKNSSLDESAGVNRDNENQGGFQNEEKL